MSALTLLIALVVIGYAITWIVGGLESANKFLRGVGKVSLWILGQVIRFAGFIIRKIGGEIPKTVGGFLERFGKKLPKLLL